ncbi:NADP-dependent oxidoreductase [uncultured Microbulbifer sp.]|uniref:NADP-dependent oxidoreductase n=1 Tax=uncultured Microbulbifer sp. TaxID=348147 RepID=UPI002608BF0B|nr:NADP-dependent oxidoreductase [uncultured Microbulbifer sp.]
MKALQITQYGDIDSSLAFQEVDVLEPGAGEVLIKIHAAAINPVDLMVMRGDLKAVKKLNLPVGIGRDLSGEVVSVGSGVSEYQTGDAVFARVGEDHVGTVAQSLVVDASHLAKKPENLSHEESASVPLVGLTSYQALIQVAGLKKGEKVLIHAGSGGIGSVAIQLAKAYGAYVITTTSSDNVEWVRKLGADQVIDYKKENYLELLSGIDVVYDTLGNQYTKEAFKVLKQGGRVVSIAGVLDPQSARELGINWLLRKLIRLRSGPILKLAKQKNALYRMVIMQPNGDQLRELAALYQDKILSPVIDKIYPFEQSIAAFSHLNTKRAKGKVVISVGGST